MRSREFKMAFNDSSKRHRGDIFCRYCNQTVTFYRHRLEHEANGQVQNKAPTEQLSGAVSYKYGH